MWRVKFRAEGGMEKKLSLGAYPEISLKEARAARDEARRILANGIDPAMKKQRDKHIAKVNASNTFSTFAKAYIEKNRRDGLAEATVSKPEWFLRLVERSLGNRPINEIAPYEILEAVRPYEAAKNDEKAHRTLQFVGQVFRFAVANQLAPSDPTRDLRGALVRRKPKHLAAVLSEKKAGELLRAIDGYEGGPLTRMALQLSALLFVRPGELCGAEWSELDLELGVLRIPAARMNGRIEHVVPLPRQAIALFQQWISPTRCGPPDRRGVFRTHATGSRPAPVRQASRA
ncbi:MAG: integrase arm-type DNA-binding domain-containing protein [Rhodobacteraceae bacterium]|nr:integrase arm-type DNA-binding domain-containing protein [Paracoccaceae bacterium]